ncbi:MAG: hypothetical protein ABWY13_01035 [Mesorhizobium sp.]
MERQDFMGEETETFRGSPHAILARNLVSTTTSIRRGETWVHVWAGTSYAGGGEVTVAVPLGQPAVFYRSSSGFADLFAELTSF